MLGKALKLRVTHLAGQPEWTLSTRAGSVDDAFKYLNSCDPKIVHNVFIVDKACRTGTTRAKCVVFQLRTFLRDTAINAAVILHEQQPRGVTPNYYVYKADMLRVLLPWNI